MQTDDNEFTCLLVEPASADTVKSGVQKVPLARLRERPMVKDAADVVWIRVEYSSLNYKDALAATGHRGVVKHLPHVPGIDCAGTVLECSSDAFAVGQPVLVTGYDLGQGHWGGWSEIVCVPTSWVVALPSSLSTREAMVLGTAGFTAAQSVMAIVRNGVSADDGEIVVTGATGGVGSLSVRLLSLLGYSVTAVTGKADQEAGLRALGAKQVVSREEILSDSKRPLLSASWAGAIDTVGGDMLNSLLRSTRYGGVVTACGLVAGAELEMTVYPFLLRGISLCGIASADCPREKRLEIWEKLAGDWRLEDLQHEDFCREIALDQLPGEVERILAGAVVGRRLVRI